MYLIRIREKMQVINLKMKRPALISIFLVIIVGIYTVGFFINENISEISIFVSLGVMLLTLGWFYRKGLYLSVLFLAWLYVLISTAFFLFLYLGLP